MHLIKRCTYTALTRSLGFGQPLSIINKRYIYTSNSDENYKRFLEACDRERTLLKEKNKLNQETTQPLPNTLPSSSNKVNNEEFEKLGLSGCYTTSPNSQVNSQTSTQSPSESTLMASNKTTTSASLSSNVLNPSSPFNTESGATSPQFSTGNLSNMPIESSKKDTEEGLSKVEDDKAESDELGPIYSELRRFEPQVPGQVLYPATEEDIRILSSSNTKYPLPLSVEGGIIVRLVRLSDAVTSPVSRSVRNRQYGVRSSAERWVILLWGGFFTSVVATLGFWQLKRMYWKKKLVEYRRSQLALPIFFLNPSNGPFPWAIPKISSNKSVKPSPPSDTLPVEYPDTPPNAPSDSPIDTPPTTPPDIPPDTQQPGTKPTSKYIPPLTNSPNTSQISTIFYKMLTKFYSSDDTKSQKSAETTNQKSLLSEPSKQDYHEPQAESELFLESAEKNKLLKFSKTISKNNLEEGKDKAKRTQGENEDTNIEKEEEIEVIKEGKTVQDKGEEGGMNEWAFRRVEMRGVLDTNWNIRVGPRASLQTGRVGYIIITPLRLEDGRTVLINRGHCSVDDLENLLEHDIPEWVRVRGVLTEGETLNTLVKWKKLKNKPQIKRFITADPHELGMSVSPININECTTAILNAYDIFYEEDANLLPIHRRKRHTQFEMKQKTDYLIFWADEHTHFNYAIQWFAMSAVVAAMTLFKYVQVLRWKF